MEPTILATTVSADQEGKQPNSIIKDLPEQFGLTM